MDLQIKTLNFFEENLELNRVKKKKQKSENGSGWRKCSSARSPLSLSINIYIYKSLEVLNTIPQRHEDQSGYEK